MPKQKTNKILVVFFLIFTLSFLYFSYAKAYESADGDIIINEDTTWHKDDNLAFNNPIFISDGATLTIEKGAQIELGEIDEYSGGAYIDVSGGRIVANGAPDEPIKIISTASTHDNYLINFWDGSSFTDMVSFLRYVEISGGGRKANNDPAPLQCYLISTAYASSVGIPAVYFESGKAHFENCKFSNNEYADVGVEYREKGSNRGSYLEIVNSNFEKNNDSLAVNSEINCENGKFDCMKALLKNNWYGGSRGPIEEASEDDADGKELAGVFNLDGWRTSNVIADPAIIIPGIMGSSEENGDWKLDPILHTYDDLLESLEENGYEKNINLFEFPYDWRNKNEDSAERLQSKIESVIDSTKVSKVDLAAHSMGGLVARSYIEGEDYKNNVDQLITLGTPHRGSPEAYLKWEAGEGFFTLADKIVRNHFEEEAKHNGYESLYAYIQEQIPSIKELLPDYDYLFDISKNSLRNYPGNYPKNAFLENLNKKSNSEKLKNADFTNIIGVLKSEQKTISKIKVVNSAVAWKWDDGMPENFYDENTDQGLEYGKGDGTVPEKSAEDILADETLKTNSSHSDLPTIAQCAIFQEFTGLSDCESVVKTHIPNILLINVFSPIDIQIIDPDGNKIGKNFDTGKEFNEISGAFYTGYNTENEFITIPNPKDGEYKIITQGMGNGEYKIEAVKISEDENSSNEAAESAVEIAGTAVLGKQEEFKITIIGDTVKNENQEVISSGDEKDNGVAQIAATDQSASDDDNNEDDNDDDDGNDKSDKKSKKTKNASVATFSAESNEQSVAGNFTNPFENANSVFANANDASNNKLSEKVAGAETNDQNNLSESKTGKRKSLLIFLGVIVLGGAAWLISIKTRHQVK